jgi:hypothetical protein
VKEMSFIVLLWIIAIVAIPLALVAVVLENVHKNIDIKFFDIAPAFIVGVIPLVNILLIIHAVAMIAQVLSHRGFRESRLNFTIIPVRKNKK